MPATQASSTTRFTITGTGTSATYTVMAGWVKRRQCEVIDYLKEENLYYLTLQFFAGREDFFCADASCSRSQQLLSPRLPAYPADDDGIGLLC